MKVVSRFTLKTLLSSTLAAALLTTTIGSTAMASDYGNHQNNHASIYRDGNFGIIAQKLRQDLRRSGYQVMDIQADSYRGNQSLVVYAKKNNQPYEMKYTYPGLKLISSSQKDWSNIWKDKDRHHGNNYHNNKHDNNNIEDNIKKEARYPAVKQRAINKVRNLGYTIKDIELKEEDNRGIFEIEAKRGNQDYDIVLGYPNLNVIKLEKD